eukprot:6286-Heterococcus_DN1.PRE.4
MTQRITIQQIAVVASFVHMYAQHTDTSHTVVYTDCTVSKRICFADCKIMFSVQKACKCDQRSTDLKVCKRHALDVASSCYNYDRVIIS